MDKGNDPISNLGRRRRFGVGLPLSVMELESEEVMEGPVARIACFEAMVGSRMEVRRSRSS